MKKLKFKLLMCLFISVCLRKYGEELDLSFGGWLAHSAAIRRANLFVRSGVQDWASDGTHIYDQTKLKQGRLEYCWSIRH